MMMTFEVKLLLLRIGVSLALYIFLAGIFYYLWKDSLTAPESRRSNLSSQGKLIIINHDNILPADIEEYDLLPITTIGRGPTNTIVIPDTFASTDHARIYYQRGQWWITDQKSRNGTLLNEILISSPIVLSSGDVISIGRIKFRFESAKTHKQ